ncbi:MAG TPA: ABC transporter ATP-binding protein [Pseudonocardiaceae bacterium]|jgi:peptide/nickel transport system ATP-binding protein|nr:ABC transporter ATP-binding protein [Pseudonocardiaceae bacterium]
MNPEATVNTVNTEAPASTAEPVLDVRGLSVDYGYGADAVHAVADVDLVLHPGEVLGLAGESGSGKSTLAYAITRLLRPPGVITGGTVAFHTAAHTTVDLLTADAKQLRALRWSEISVVFQSAMHALNPVYTVGRQLTDVLLAHCPELGRAQRRSKALELLSLVNIPQDRIGSYPHELSGGMRQRVMIAMALALRPRVVIMDEPTTALDVVTQREIVAELIGLRDRLGFAVVFITHDLSLLIELADSIAVMYAGRLVERAPAEALFRAPRHPYTQGLLNSFPPLHGEWRKLAGIPGSPPDLSQVPAGCPFHPRCSFVLPECTTTQPELAPVGAGREVSCWLHEPTRTPPPELARPEPLATSNAGGAR